MAYTRHTWQSGEVISSALLNNIEDGIEEAASSGGGSERFIIECTLDGENSTEKQKVYTHNVTLQEAYEAFESGREIYAKINLETGILYVHLNNVNKESDTIMFTAALHNPVNNSILFIFAFSQDNKIFVLKSSGSEPIIFNATMDLHSGDVTNTSCNYTYDQIKEMSQNPTMPLTATVIIKYDGGIFGTVSGYSIEAYTGVDSITFSRLSYKQNNLVNDIITYHSDGSVNLSTSTIMTK